MGPITVASSASPSTTPLTPNMGEGEKEGTTMRTYTDTIVQSVIKEVMVFVPKVVTESMTSSFETMLEPTIAKSTELFDRLLPRLVTVEKGLAQLQAAQRADAPVSESVVVDVPVAVPRPPERFRSPSSACASSRTPSALVADRECKFGRQCYRADCVFRHPPDRVLPEARRGRPSREPDRRRVASRISSSTRGAGGRGGIDYSRFDGLGDSDSDEREQVTMEEEMLRAGTSWADLTMDRD